MPVALKYPDCCLPKRVRHSLLKLATAMPPSFTPSSISEEKPALPPKLTSGSMLSFCCSSCRLGLLRLRPMVRMSSRLKSPKLMRLPVASAAFNSGDILRVPSS